LAQKSPRENLVRQLSKLGDTIYECTQVDVPEDFNFFIPNSQLSDMRRQLIDAMSEIKRSIKRARVVGNPGVSELSYQNNISNRQSAAFYGTDELSAYELKGGDGPIMQCRHCLRYSLGYCVKRGGKRPTWREPLSLVLGDGRRFRLEFDCQHCQMNVHASTR
jgi:putative protease